MTKKTVFECRPHPVVWKREEERLSESSNWICRNGVWLLWSPPHRGGVLALPTVTAVCCGCAGSEGLSACFWCAFFWGWVTLVWGRRSIWTQHVLSDLQRHKWRIRCSTGTASVPEDVLWSWTEEERVWTPFLLKHLCSCLPHLTKMRCEWNVNKF